MNDRTEDKTSGTQPAGAAPGDPVRPEQGEPAAASAPGPARRLRFRLAASPHPPPPPTPLFPRFRVLMWAVQITALLAVLEYFLVRNTRLPALPQPPVPVARAQPPRAVAGTPAPVLGDRALAMAGLREVAGACLPNTDALAAGSALTQETQRRFALDQGLPVEVVNTVGMHFRLVPPGTFLMGSPEGEPGRWERETPHVAVIERPLYLGVYEVTQAEWQAVMGPCPAGFPGPTRPAEEVTWYDAQRFVNALCEREQVPRGTYRLPTEAEWEYACRAGTATAYCFGDDPGRLAEYADYRASNNRSTASVGQRLPNAFGLHDMHGNVWEWCQDRFRDYGGDDAAAGLPDYEQRAIRGGMWLDPPENCRSANRCRLTATSHGNMLGLRVVRAVTPPAPPAPARPATAGDAPPAGP